MLPPWNSIKIWAATRVQQTHAASGPGGRAARTLTGSEPAEQHGSHVTRSTVISVPSESPCQLISGKSSARGRSESRAGPNLNQAEPTMIMIENVQC
jgi:hypothetical protein